MKRKQALSYLMALFMLASKGGIVSNVKAEEQGSDKQINYVIENIVPYKINTIYNMTDEQANEKLESNVNLVRFLMNEISTVVPAYGYVYNGLVADDDKREDKLFDLEVGNSMLQSEFESEFEPIGMDSLFLLLREISSKSIMGYLNYKNGEFKFAKNYFSNLEISNFDKKLELLGIFSLEDYIMQRYPYEKKFEPDYSKPKTIGEYKEKIYEKYVDRNEWPIDRTNEISFNENETLPQLKEEILNSSLIDKLLIYIYDPVERKAVKTLIGYSDNKNILRDLFTNETLTANKDSKNINPKYAKNINMEKDLIILISTLKSKEYFGIPTNIVELNKYIPSFQKVTTLQDAIDAYQLFPLELQMDYSYFDFKKSPNVVQDKKKSNKNNVEERLLALIDMEEKKLNAIDKPKTKELTKKS